MQWLLSSFLRTALEYAKGLIYLNFAMYITILLWSVGYIYAVSQVTLVFFFPIDCVSMNSQSAAFLQNFKY